MQREDRIHIGLIVVAHRCGIARHMAEVANHLLDTDAIKYHDIPLTRSNAQTLEELCKLIRETDEGAGVVLLVDMGFLLTMEESLSRQTGVMVRILPHVSTAMVLEAGQRIFSHAADIDSYVEALDTAYGDYLLVTRQSNMPPKESVQESSYEWRILVQCTAGLGAAQKLKDLLLSELPELSVAKFLLRGDLDTESEVKLPIGMVFGTDDPVLPGVPFFSVSSLFEPRGLQEIRSIFAADKEQKLIAQGKYAHTY